MVLLFVWLPAYCIHCSIQPLFSGLLASVQLCFCALLPGVFWSQTPSEKRIYLHKQYHVRRFAGKKIKIQLSKSSWATNFFNQHLSLPSVYWIMAENVCSSFHLLLCTDSSYQLKYILFSNLGWTETLKEDLVYGMRKNMVVLNKEQKASHASASLQPRLDLCWRLIKMHIRNKIYPSACWDFRSVMAEQLYQNRAGSGKLTTVADSWRNHSRNRCA